MSLYEILGVNKNADENEIKKKYRRKAMTSHPDKGGDPERFKELNRAYEILSNPQKRQIYDNYGEKALEEFESQQSHPFMNPENIQVKLQPLIVRVEFTVEEIYHGTTKKIEAERMVLTGDIKIPSTVNKETQKFTIEAKITPFSIYGQKYVHHGQGHRHVSDESLRGDLIVIVIPKRESNSPWTMINKKDLQYRLVLTLSEALLGFKIKIRHLNGKTIVITNTQTTVPGTVRYFPDLGYQHTAMTMRGPMTETGKLFILFDLKIPETLTNAQKKLVLSAFGRPRLDKSDENDILVKFDQIKDPEKDIPEDGNKQEAIFIQGMPGMHGGQPGECCVM